MESVTLGEPEIFFPERHRKVQLSLAQILHFTKLFFFAYVELNDLSIAQYPKFFV